METPWQSYSPARIELAFGDGEYSFAVPWRMVAELQQACGTEVRFPDGSTGRRPKGLGLIWSEIRERAYNERDLREIVRLGLIGGGGGYVGRSDGTGGERVDMTATLALHLLHTYVGSDSDRVLPADSLWALAFAIMAACVQGYEPPKKDEATKD